MDPPELQMPKFLGSMPNITASKGENVSMTCVVENLGMYKVKNLILYGILPRLCNTEGLNTNYRWLG